MKILMSANPRTPEKAEKSHWTIRVIRAFGVLQIIGSALASYVYLRPVIQYSIVSATSMDYDGTVLLSTILSVLIGLGAGCVGSVMTFALAMFLDDVHTIRGYLRDVQITGQYHDD